MLLVLLNVSNVRENKEKMQLTKIHSNKRFGIFGSIGYQSRSGFGSLGAV